MRWLRRIGWFVLLWCLGPAVLAVLALLVRA